MAEATAEPDAIPAFEVFDRTAPRPGSSEVAISLQKSGVISLSPSAYEVMGRPAAVELLYAPRERIIGLRPAPEATPHAYPVREHRASGMRVVSGAAFTRAYGIDTKQTRRYPARLIEGILAVDLGSNTARSR